MTYRLRSGLLEGSSEANEAEATESARFDREQGTAPRTHRGEPSDPTATIRRLRRLGIDFRA